MQQQLLESGNSQLSLRVYKATEPARASVVVGSAMGVRQNFYAPFVGWLFRQGFRVTTFDYRGSGASLPDTAHGGLRGFKADLFFPVLALSVTDDELMTWRGTQNLIKLYTGALRSFDHITPADLGVKRIGHFGFFRQHFSDSLWPRTVQILERMQPLPAQAGVAGTTA